MSVQVKICGINDAAAMQAAVDAGASFVGLVFYPPSPRNVTIEEAAKLAALVPDTVTIVGLFVDPRDEDLRNVLKDVPLGVIQLHGDETPVRVVNIKNLTGLPVMKAIKLGSKADLDAIPAFEAVADWLLFDAKVADNALPGGNAKTFDWSLLRGRAFSKPWMLAGGLNAGNIRAAIEATGATTIDVSSGVEDAPGHKNPSKIRELISIARSL